MAEFLLDLFSEEIPAGMQHRAAQDLARLLQDSLAPLDPRHIREFYGPRRISVIMELEPRIAGRVISERGPRETAPQMALEGFLRKHGAKSEDLIKENGFWVLQKILPEVQAEAHLAAVLPDILWKFPWPKTMRWGSGSAFTWVRPLHHITCLLDSHIIPFTLAHGTDEAHGLCTSDQTEGHRFLAPGTFRVENARDWEAKLAAHFVILKAEDRKKRISDAVHHLATDKGLILVEDHALIEEVAGLVEYPVALAGQIDVCFMDLPPEVMQVSMRVNQRYFALRHKDGSAAPWFAFIANRDFADGGALSISGNERVLRARFADARHFWDLDRKTPLARRVDRLDSVIFHARLGTQKARSERIASLAGQIAEAMGLSAEEKIQAKRAGLLAKADLTSGMVGEFPELQGIMGGYYARHDGEDEAVARAIAEHYMPRGQNDDIPHAPVSIAVSLADKLDMLAGFFSIGETPSGSGDPYGLRRAALGVIRIIRDRHLRIDLGHLLTKAAAPFTQHNSTAQKLEELEGFFTERLKVQLRNEGQRYDVLEATLSTNTIRNSETLFSRQLDGDFTRLLGRVSALSDMIGTEDGKNLLAAYKRAANILRIENKKDGPHQGLPDAAQHKQEEERALHQVIEESHNAIEAALAQDDFTIAMRALASLRPVIDGFFEAVTINAENPDLRKNRLSLLNAFITRASQIADFSRIEG